MNLPRLVVMVGLPRSGKSTVVREVYRPQGFAVVCPDDVRLELHGQRYAENAENFVWATVFVMVDALRRSGCPVVVDGCHATKKRRAPWTRRGAEFHTVGTAAEACLDRAEIEGDMAIVPVIRRMAAEWEPVAADETMDAMRPAPHVPRGPS